jgi:transposase
LRVFPTAAALGTVSIRKLARLCYDGSDHVGDALARDLIEAAKLSVGAHYTEPYQLQLRCGCENIDVLRRRLRSVENDIERRLEQRDVGKLFKTIVGIGPQTAACIMGEIADPARFQ